MAEKRRWKELDILRGMAILMVLLYHSIIVYPLNLHEIRWCSLLHTGLWTVQMPLFFLVSGFCYSFSGDFCQYARSRCRRILIPHIVFSALDILPRLIPNPLVHEQMDVGEAVLDFLLYGGSDWFLWTLFVIAMVFPLLERLLLCGGIWRRVGIVLVGCLFLTKPYVTDLLLMNMVCQYLLYFLLGYLLRRHTALLPGLERLRNFPMGLAAAAALFVCLIRFREAGGSLTAGLILELFCVLAGFWALLPLAAHLRGWGSAFLRLCGTWSLQMYLLDAYALVLTRTLLTQVLGWRSPALIIGGNFILDTAIVLCLSRFLLTKAKVFRVFCGIPEKGS